MEYSERCWMKKFIKRSDLGSFFVLSYFLCVLLCWHLQLARVWGMISWVCIFNDETCMNLKLSWNLEGGIIECQNGGLNEICQNSIMSLQHMASCMGRDSDWNKKHQQVQSFISRICLCWRKKYKVLNKYVFWNGARKRS